MLENHCCSHLRGVSVTIWRGRVSCWPSFPFAEAVFPGRTSSGCQLPSPEEEHPDQMGHPTDSSVYFTYCRDSSKSFRCNLPVNSGCLLALLQIRAQKCFLFRTNSLIHRTDFHQSGFWRDSVNKVDKALPRVRGRGQTINK